MEGGLDTFTKVHHSTTHARIIAQLLTNIQGFDKFGFNVLSNGDILYREWAPNALEAYLIGEFSELFSDSV